MTPSDLPFAAARKFSALQGARQNAEDLTRSAALRREELNRSISYRKSPPASQIEQAELDRLGDQMRSQAAKRDELSRVCSTITAWIQKLRGGVEIEDGPPVRPELVDGEDLPTALARIQTQIGTVTNHLDVVRCAPLPRADIRAQASEFVAQMGLRARPRLELRADRLTVDFINPQVMDGSTALLDSIAIQCWSNPKHMLAAIEKEIERQLPPPDMAIPREERLRRELELAAEIERLGHVEEALITECESRGIAVERRSEADPKCVLNVRLKKPAKAKAAA
jgi:hypothetical protein